ncbi:hypothetical protein [Streptomyces griseus]|uniref:hypothetical protein n=1 Tax=Streptomyces griseus TaxID=1911 RepID=UPI0037A4A170
MAARKTTPPPSEPQEETGPAPVPEPQDPAPSTPAEPPEPDVVEEQPTEEEPQAPTAVEAAYVEALQREREGYTRYGRKDRAADVEAELKRLGAPLERAVTRPPETA